MKFPDLCLMVYGRLTAMKSTRNDLHLSPGMLAVTALTAGKDFGSMVTNDNLYLGLVVLGFVMLLVCIVSIYRAFRCWRSPDTCQDAFMTKQGWTKSIVAHMFWASPDAARKAVIQDERIRRLYILELCGRAVFSFLCSVTSFVAVYFVVR